MSSGFAARIRSGVQKAMTRSCRARDESAALAVPTSDGTRSSRAAANRAMERRTGTYPSAATGAPPCALHRSRRPGICRTITARSMPSSGGHRCRTATAKGRGEQAPDTTKPPARRGLSVERGLDSCCGLRGADTRGPGAFRALLDVELDRFSAHQAVEVERLLQAAAMEKVVLAVLAGDETE